MSKTRKWPFRVVNLLVALSMVISLCLLMAPPALAQEECDPTERHTPCNLEVAVNTYTKDANGDFTPAMYFDSGDCFYVNAVVANTGNETAYESVNATISFRGDVGLYSGEVATKEWYAQQTGNLSACKLADFWWKVCCTAATGPAQIDVAAVADDGQGSTCTGSGTTTVVQGIPPEYRCLEIKIVEAPGLGTVTGRLLDEHGDPIVYTSYLASTVNPCTTFGIKAEVTNLCWDMSCVNATISWTGPASLVEIGDPDPNEWALGPMDYGETQLVAWTLHCDGPGDVAITVGAEDCTHTSLAQYIIEDLNDITIHQREPGGLSVMIDHPLDGDVQPTGDCGAEDFTVDATVENTGDSIVTNIIASVEADPDDAVTFGWPPSTAPFTLGPGQHTHVSFDATCVDTGDVDITVSATGLSPEGIVTGNDMHTITQADLIATVYAAPPSEVNKCQTFDVTFRYYNYTGVNLENVDTCVYWTGPAELADSVYYRRVVSGNPQPWTLMDSSPTTLGNETLWYSCEYTGDICDCCDLDVRWSFTCTDIGEVNIYSTVTKAARSATSETVSVDQVWKAHLIANFMTYVQDENGLMWYREAFTPGTEFHVVFAVMNTGDADAEDVEIDFSVTGLPAGSYEFLSASGDISDIDFNETTGAGTAYIDLIPGHGMAKAILLLRCLAEGNVDIWIPEGGLTGDDANTGAPIPDDNICLPPCPLRVEQVPFRIELVNPEECQTFSPGEHFAVKALISNDSQQDLLDVSATIFIEGYAALAQDWEQNETKGIGNLTAGSQSEITWELVCTSPGEVYIEVRADSADPALSAWTDVVNVHQRDMANIEVTIISPDYNYHDQEDGTNAKIATGEQFAVTALVNCTGSLTSENVSVWIEEPYCMTVIGPDEFNLGDMHQGDQEMVTFTLVPRCTGDIECDTVTMDVCVDSQTDSEESNYDDNDDCVDITVYPAAHLVAEITEIDPASPIGVCEEFEVTYRVYNYGEADAWEVSATLSVEPEGSVRIAEGEGGYTQYLGTITGWNYFSEGYYYIENSFILHCKQACESTLTITPAGNDECGWFSYVEGDDNDIHWSQQAGREIDAEFIDADSETVKQLDSGSLDLSITKAVDDAYPDVSDTVAFTIVVTNEGPTDASGVVVEDDLPSGLTYVSNIPSQGSYSSSTDDWTVGNIVAGGSASLVINATATTTSQRTNTASITACDQPDPFADNDSASVVLNKPAVTSVDIALADGWNLISLPLIPDSSDIEDVLAGVESNVAIVWAYTAGSGWSSYIPSGPPPTLTTMVDGKGYWIDMDAGDTLTVTGDELPLPPNTPPTYSVAVGWNLIGFKSTVDRTASDYLAAIAGDWTRIYGYANGMFFAVQSGDNMEPGLGYWIAVTAAGTIYP